jgi:hypothetical protein
MSQQTSAIVRLKSLPPIFRGADLTVRFQWTSRRASHYLYLWKKRGLVEGLGGHSDVYANRLTTDHPNWEKALLSAMPSAVVIGVEALRRAGWTTQIPTLPTVAVSTKQKVFKVTPFDVHRRSPEWFENTKKGLQTYAEVCLPMMRPAWALADLLKEQGWGKCGLHADDIDWSEITEQDECDWQAACSSLGLPMTALHSLAVASR